MLAAGLMLLTAGCSSGPSAGATAGAPESTVRIGLIGIMSDAPVAIAMERGYFEKFGVSLTIQAFASGGAMVAPMAAGDLDVGGGAFSAGMVNAVASGNPLVIVADKGSFPTPELGSQQFVVRADLKDHIKNFSDLRGRQIGVGTAVGTAPFSGVIEALHGAGIVDPQDHVTSMSSADMVVALSQRAVDAAWLSEPNATLAIRQGAAVPWKTAFDVAPGEQDSTIFYNSRWAEDNPQLAQSFMNAYVCGLTDYLTELDDPNKRADVLRIISEYTDTEVDVLEQARPPGYFQGGIPDKASIEHIVNSFEALGQVERTVPIDQLVSLRYVEAAAGVTCR
jgi:NitT/TauT family transport system substrate-binding protein